MILDSLLKLYGKNPTIPSPPNDGRSFTNIVYYLGKMQLKWFFLPKSVKTSIYWGIVREYSTFDPFSITNLFAA
jgi:hypothetical protein